MRVEEQIFGREVSRQCQSIDGIHFIPENTKNEIKMLLSWFIGIAHTGRRNRQIVHHLSPPCTQPQACQQFCCGLCWPFLGCGAIIRDVMCYKLEGKKECMTFKLLQTYYISQMEILTHFSCLVLTECTIRRSKVEKWDDEIYPCLTFI